MNNNQVIIEAVDAQNAAASQQVQNEAIRLINEIRNQQDKITDSGDRIAAHRRELSKLSQDVISEASVFGGSVPDNANHNTIVAVIEKANKVRQFQVEQVSGRLTSAIVAEQDAIVVVEKRVVEIRKAIANLNVPEVTISDIVG